VHAEPSPDTVLSPQVFTKVKSADWNLRYQAYTVLSEALAKTLDNNESSDDRVNLAIIDLLQQEVNHSSEDMDESQSEYLAELIVTVGSLHDMRAANLLLHPFVIGTGASIGNLADLGDQVFTQVLANYNNHSIQNRFPYMMVMIKIMEEGTIQNSTYASDIEKVFLTETKSPTGLDRDTALRGLANFVDAAALGRVIEMAQSDPQPVVRSNAARIRAAQQTNLEKLSPENTKQ